MQIERKLLALLTFGLLASGAVFAQEGAKKDDGKKDEAPKTAKVGEAAPDFTLKGCCGTEWKLSDHQDKVVVLEWTNQECPWVIRSIPHVKELVKKYADKDVIWMPIESTRTRKAEENVKYIKDKELPFKTILMDNDGAVGRRYDAKVTPHVFVIAKGKLVYAGALHNDQHGNKEASEVRNYVDDAIQAALDGKEVPVAETRPWGCTVKY